MGDNPVCCFLKLFFVSKQTVITGNVFVLYSADATQDGALDRFKTKIVLSSNGRNMWLGPVLYTFSCKINVDFFPFDEQVSLLLIIQFGELFSHFDWLLLDVVEGRHADDVIDNIIYFFTFIKQVDSMLLCVCSVTDHRRCQNVVRTSVAHSDNGSSATF